MRIIGIDPGTTLIGYGVIEKTKERWLSLDYGVWRATPNIPTSEKVVGVFDFFDQLLKKYQPQEAGLEKLFFFKNAKTITAVSEIRGVILLALQKNLIKTKEFTPLQVKQAITGYGKAEKKQVQNMVKIILNLQEIPRPDDAADALAIALCCAHTVTF